MNYLTAIKNGVKKLPSIGKTALTVMDKNSPAILSGFALAGVLGTAFFTAKAGPKAYRAIEAEKQAREEERIKASDSSAYAAEKIADLAPVELTPWEITKLCWKYYIPAGLTVLGTGVCIISAQKINSNRLSALATALSLSETARKELEEKVSEKLGPNKLGRFKDEIAQDGVNKDDPNCQFVYDTGYGTTLFKDDWSGRYFYCSKEHIDRTVNDLNYRLIGGEYYISLNEWYMSLGLPPLRQGGDFGWDLHNSGMIEVNTHHCTWTDDGKTPCAVLEYDISPRYDYQNS